MTDERMDPRFRAAVRDELERLPQRPAGGRGRAPRPWFAAVVAVVVAALVVGVSALALRGAPHEVPASPSPTPTVSPTATARVTALGPVVATLPAAQVGTIAFSAASDTALYTATSGEDDGRHWTIRRVDVATGAIVKRSLDLAYLDHLTVGADGLYVTTSVIERFPNTGDSVLRLDLQTLRTLATIHPKLVSQQDSGLEALPVAGSLYLTSLSGSVVRLDPLTLKTIARRDLLSAIQVQDGDGISGVVLAEGRVWALTPGFLVALDPSSLSVARRIPLAGVLQRDSFARPIALEGALVLVGSSIVRVPVGGNPVAVGSIGDTSFVGETAGVLAAWLDATDDVRVELIDADGRVRAVQQMDSGTGSIVAAAPHVLWVQGLPGHPTELAAIRVAVPPGG